MRAICSRTTRTRTMRMRESGIDMCFSVQQRVLQREGERGGEREREGERGNDRKGEGGRRGARRLVSRLSSLVSRRLVRCVTNQAQAPYPRQALILGFSRLGWLRGLSSNEFSHTTSVSHRTLPRSRSLGTFLGRRQFAETAGHARLQASIWRATGRTCGQERE